MRLARVASSCMSNRQMHGPDLLKKSQPNSVGNGSRNNTLKVKNEHSESSDEEEFDGTVQADFAFFDPKPDDFHGVKTLLQTYLDDIEWDLSGFVDLILEQTTVGTVDHKCFMDVKEFLLKVSQAKDVIDDLRSLLGKEAESVGLLVSQRVMNLPPQLLPPLYDALFDEVSWATEDEPTEELRNFFRFKFYIIVSKVYKHKNAHQKKGMSASDEEIIYIKPEDEIFHELRDYQQMGLVMAVKTDKIPAFRQQLKSFIEGS
ncbi:CDK inhibitor P21 binding protein [Prunus dulcis]|uniref:CDK inhibitor P21 binding protein n=1 Tax=Prunus dulcis TaxID=3755 RepID=A0A4Y1RWI0_PRUDU|nr:CDK inhibitor P21 binding protein [Prunus dulcis]